MVGQRTVAGFAVDVDVFALSFGGYYIAVAVCAGLVAGKLDGARGDFRNGSAAIVAVLTKAFGNHVATNDQEGKKGKNEKPCEAEEMSCIL